LARHGNKWKISSLIPDTECPEVKVLGYGKSSVNLNILKG